MKKIIIFTIVLISITITNKVYSVEKSNEGHKIETQNIKIYENIPESSNYEKSNNSKKISKKILTKAKELLGGKLQIVALILCILLGILGVHRFYLGYTGLGVLYLLTGGLFLIGWIIDILLLIIPNGLTPKGQTNYK